MRLWKCLYRVTGYVHCSLQNLAFVIRNSFFPLPTAPQSFKIFYMQAKKKNSLVDRWYGQKQGYEVLVAPKSTPEVHRPHSSVWLEWIRGGVTKDCGRGKKKNNTMFVENGKKTIPEKRRNFTHSVPSLLSLFFRHLNLPN